jgi:hypothetical protein
MKYAYFCYLFHVINRIFKGVFVVKPPTNCIENYFNLTDNKKLYKSTMAITPYKFTSPPRMDELRILHG